MKKIIMILFCMSIASPVFAATVGGPDMSIPEESWFLKQRAVDADLDRYEYNMNVKGSFEAELGFGRDIDSAEDISSGEVKGQNYMLKFSSNFHDIVEPYIKVGTSNLQVRWVQHGYDVEVEAGPGFMWAMGARARLLDIKEYGIKLTLDFQTRTMKPEINKAMLGGSESTAAASDKKFKITEWQTSLLASKKIIVNLGKNDFYLVPYGGITHTLSEIDVSFIQGNPGPIYSTYDANDRNDFGLVIGCDIMPFYLNHYLYNIELRLINELGLTLGGTVKF